MRVSNQVLLRKIAGENILVPIDDMLERFNGIMALNESGLLLWEALQKECTEEELIQTLLETYDTDHETAEKDVREFLKQLEKAEILII